MAAYRIYILDNEALVFRVNIVEAITDEEARELARQWANNQSYELWKDARRIEKSSDALPAMSSLPSDDLIA